MSLQKVKIKIYSEKKETSLIRTAINQLGLKDFEVSSTFPRKLEVNADEIIILQTDNLNSKLLNKIVELKEKHKNKFIIVIRNENALFVSTLVKMGFYDLFIFPHEIYKFTSYLQEIITNKQYITAFPEQGSSDLLDFSSVAGNSPAMLKVIEVAKKISKNRNISILLLGETGTGKGLLARAIHESSRGYNAPFVEIVCSAIPEDLLESELFGYEKGAFTNALNKKLGLFEIAEGGTIFLDEIGDLSANLQVKLLRVIEKKVIRRLGGIEDIPVNIRIISATNRNLQEMVDNNLFRPDLFHRLNTISIVLPPLRERGDDILLLAKNFIKEFNKQFNKSVETVFEKELEEFMLSYSWPGNIRELRNAVERAVLLGEDKKLQVNDFTNLLKNLPLNMLEKDEHIHLHPDLIRLDLNFGNTNLDKLTRIYAKEVLRKMKGNKSKSAEVLNVSRPKLDKLLK